MKMKKIILFVSLILALNACSLVQPKSRTFDLPKENGDIMDLAQETSDAELLSFLADHKNQGVRANVAGNINTPVESLEKLSNDEVWSVLSYLASNDNTPQDILEKLSQNEDERVRWVVAKNSNTNKELLSKFIEDSSVNVQKYLTENVSLDTNLMTQIAEKSMAPAVLNLLERNDLPEEVINILKKSNNDKIREKAENWGKDL